MNRDQLNMVPAKDTIHAAYAALSGAQSFPPPQQVMGAAILFNEMCELLQLDPSEMLDKCRRVRINALDHYSIEMRALQDYIRGELR